MLQNKIYKNYLIEIFKTFLTILFSLTVIAWTVRAVNFLDLIVENGYPIFTYFQYSFLNLFGVLTKFIPLSFLLGLTLFIIKQIQDNEFVILWTSGVKKIEIVNLFFIISVFIAILYLLFSTFLTPVALNKSRQLLGNEKLTSFLPTVRVQQFSDSFSGLTYIVDEKYEKQVKNIFLHDTSNILKNISSKKSNNISTTIIAENGIIEDDRMVLFNGQIMSINKNQMENDLIKFTKLNIGLNNLRNNTIKKAKVQETSTLKLIACLTNNSFKDSDCKGNFKKEVLPTLNRRVILPFFIPVIALISSLLLIKNKNKIYLNKIVIFSYSFLILLTVELTIRYTGINAFINKTLIASPFFLSVFLYFFLKVKFFKE